MFCAEYISVVCVGKKCSNLLQKRPKGLHADQLDLFSRSRDYGKYLALAEHYAPKDVLTKSELTVFRSAPGASPGFKELADAGLPTEPA